MSESVPDFSAVRVLSVGDEDEERLASCSFAALEESEGHFHPFLQFRSPAGAKCFYLREMRSDKVEMRCDE